MSTKLRRIAVIAALLAVAGCSASDKYADAASSGQPR